MRTIGFGVGILLPLAIVLASCGNTGPSGFDPNADGGGDASDDSIDPFKTDTGGGDAGVCATNSCSSDLHSVLDCNGNVLTTCPDDQGCGVGGVCVPACNSARDNKSSIGCDYYSVDPDIISAGAGGCFAAYIANTWTSPVTITVERNGQSLNVANFARIPSGNGQSLTYTPLPGGQLPAGQVAIVFLAYSGFSPLCNLPAHAAVS